MVAVFTDLSVVMNTSFAVFSVIRFNRKLVTAPGGTGCQEYKKGRPLGLRLG